MEVKSRINKSGSNFDRLLLFASRRVRVSEEMSRVGNGSTSTQGRSHECCLCQLLPRRAGSFRRGAVNLKTVGALRGQSYPQGNEFLVFFGNDTISQGGFIERPESGHSLWSPIAKDAQIL
jgi:hypothetical protein